MVTHSPDAAFQAIADPTRRAMLDVLRAGRQPAGQIARLFPVSRPAISKHLRVLLRAELVRAHKSGRHQLYEIDPRPLEAVDHWLARYRAMWQSKLADLKSFVESEQSRARPRAGRPRPRKPGPRTH